MRTMPRGSFGAVALPLLAGPLIWAIHFAVVYGTVSLACARAFEGGKVIGVELVPLIVIVATLVAALQVAAIAIFALSSDSVRDHGAQTSRFLRRVTAASAVLSLVAIALEGSAMALAPYCS